MTDIYQLPDDLPIPQDDGACDHLPGAAMPSLSLQSVSGAPVDLSKTTGTVVAFFYPMNGDPNNPPADSWNDIPGARGCTPHVCSYSDKYAELEALDVTVYGISAQSQEGQKEAHQRLNVPYGLLNDSAFELTKALNLPTFEFESATYIQRLSLIIKDGVIAKVFYPVFPPHKNVDDVIAWLKAN